MVSLYANLLDPSSASSTSASISRAPVVFQPPSADNAQQDEASAKKQQISAGTLLLYSFLKTFPHWPDVLTITLCLRFLSTSCPSIPAH
jgi:hypothetical protein